MEVLVLSPAYDAVTRFIESKRREVLRRVIFIPVKNLSTTGRRRLKDRFPFAEQNKLEEKFLIFLEKRNGSSYSFSCILSFSRFRHNTKKQGQSDDIQPKTGEQENIPMSQSSLKAYHSHINQGNDVTKDASSPKSNNPSNKEKEKTAFYEEVPQTPQIPLHSYKHGTSPSDAFPS